MYDDRTVKKYLFIQVRYNVDLLRRVVSYIEIMG